MIMHKKLKFFLVLLLIYSCNTSNLGDNFFLLEGDKKEDRVIVYCTGKDEKECHSGIPVIPTYDKQFKNDAYAEYVELVKANRDWIIARTISVENNYNNYWILSKDIKVDLDNCSGNCRDIVKSNIYGPFSQSNFLNKKRELNIELELN